MRPLASIALSGLFLVGLAACGASSSPANAGPSGSAASAELSGTANLVDNAASWPRFRGVNGDGFSTETGINKAWSSKAPKLLWKTSMSDDGYAGPAAAGGLLFIVDHAGSEDIVRAWKLADGTEVWRCKYPDADSSNYGFSRSTPAYDSGKLYVVSRLGKVLCLDAKNGKILWKRDMVSEMGGQRPGWDYAGSPIIDGNRVIVTPGSADGAIVALDKTTGKTLWKGGSSAPGYSTPVVATIGGKRQIVAFLGKSVDGYDAATGQQLWSFPWQTSYDVNAATPLVIGNTVFIASGYGKGCALIDVGSGQPNLLWQNRAIQAHFSSPVFYKGNIYGTGDPGVLVCLDPASGKTLWKQQGFEKGGLVGADGVVFVQNGSNGEIAMVELRNDQYRELGRVAPVSGQAWTAPILVDKKLVVRTKTEIAVIDLN